MKKGQKVYLTATFNWENNDFISVTIPGSTSSINVPRWSVSDEVNTPEIKDFIKAIEGEALHQRLRFGAEHDVGKTDADWFWLIGHLLGKAIHANALEKKLHHIITSAAACLNWHSYKIGVYTEMRPGIKDPE